MTGSRLPIKGKMDGQQQGGGQQKHAKSASKGAGSTAFAAASTDDTGGHQNGRASHQQKRERQIDPKLNDFTIKDRQLRTALSYIIKQTARNTQEIAKTKAATYDLFIAQKKHNVIKEVEDERANYVDLQKNGHDLPESPAPYMFTRLVASLTKEDIGGSNKESMQALHKKLTQMEMMDIENLIDGVYFEKTHDTNNIKILLGMKSLPERLLIISSLKQLNFSHKPGKAPTGWMEDQLSHMIDCLTES